MIFINYFDFRYRFKFVILNSIISFCNFLSNELKFLIYIERVIIKISREKKIKYFI